MIGKFVAFLAELRRRNVLRAVGLYIVAYWVLSQGAADLFPAFGLEDWFVRAFVVSGFIGLPIVFLVSWFFDLTARGFIRAAPEDKQGVERHRPLPRDIPVDATIRSPPNRTSCVTATWQGEHGETLRRVFQTTFLIGRSIECAVHLFSPRVSRRHAEVFYENERWFIRDLGSANGTWLGNARIQQPVPVTPHCIIRCDHAGPQVILQLEELDHTEISANA